MNILKALVKAFKAPLDLLAKAFNAAKESGLTHDLVAFALPYIREANKKFVDNAERREWVVSVLVVKFKCPEGIARIAVELAFKLYREELAKAGV